MEEGGAKAQAMGAVAGVLAHSDPRFLAQEALNLPSNRSTRELVQNLANSWAQTDAHDALAWAEQLPEGAGKNDALAIIRSQLGQQNPAEVPAQINLLPSGDTRNTLISNLAAQWGASDPARAIEWANTLPEKERTLALTQVVGAWTTWRIGRRTRWRKWWR